jgi:hypothetical protein
MVAVPEPGSNVIIRMSVSGNCRGAYLNVVLVDMVVNLSSRLEHDRTPDAGIATLARGLSMPLMRVTPNHRQGWVLPESLQSNSITC